MEDNKGAIKLASDPIYTKKTKHIDLRHYFFRKNVDEEKIE